MRPREKSPRAAASVRPVQGSFARASNLGHENFRLLDSRAAVCSKDARSPERQSLSASVTCTTQELLCNRLAGFGFAGPGRNFEHLRRIEGVFHSHGRTLRLGRSARGRLAERRGVGDRRHRRVPNRRRPQGRDRSTHKCHSEGHVTHEVDSRRAPGGKVLVLSHNRYPCASTRTPCSASLSGATATSPATR
jgi:hypothetical protein